jgi:hypothetical protein
LAACAILDVDMNMVEKAKRTPTLAGDNMENIITRMMTVPKRAGAARLKAKLEQANGWKGLHKFTRVYTEGSVLENRVGYSVTNVHIQR